MRLDFQVTLGAILLVIAAALFLLSFSLAAYACHLAEPQVDAVLAVASLAGLLLMAVMVVKRRAA